MGNIVKELRGNLSQAALAKKVGISQQAIAEYEMGRFPKPETLNRIAAAVGKKVDWIITNVEQEGEKSTLKRREAADVNKVADGSPAKGKRRVYRTRWGYQEGQTKGRATTGLKR